ncbi:hypothetical protein AZ34_06025 [Hylemonella gracilis str. Niagara R]|uniref:DUF1653 domain-containing protein n=1 Tax=Hylemonella gracilis str. Niagara R TaxID=1458275 RepID=A0A016XFI3_9BURK|nr:DUF1653 domain-containing protein [Hylemonella gracilis]EYC50665.1 hypothetical protein AZ34_06025 [Hylemonella gracilis str. Niagara R]
MTSETLPPLIEIRPGLYRHYKNLPYEVLGTVRHSETLEPMTLYRALYGERGLWVRPAAMFQEEVVVNGVRQARFTWIGEADGGSDISASVRPQT